MVLRRDGPLPAPSSVREPNRNRVHRRDWRAAHVCNILRSSRTARIRSPSVFRFSGFLTPSATKPLSEILYFLNVKHEILQNLQVPSVRRNDSNLQGSQETAGKCLLRGAGLDGGRRGLGRVCGTPRESPWAGGPGLRLRVPVGSSPRIGTRLDF